MTELLRGLPPLLASHFEIALVALTAGIAISLPLAIAIARRPRAAAGVLAVAGVIQTVPGLALLALMVPVLAHTAGLNEEVFDALILLAAGSWEADALRRGHAAVIELQKDMDEGRRSRLLRLGFDAAQAAALSQLHTRNFM